MPCGSQEVHLEIHSTIEALDLVQAITEHIARRLGFDEDIVVERREERANELLARQGAIHAALKSIDALAHHRKLPPELVENLRHHYRVLLRELERTRAEVRASRLADELELEVI